MWPFSSPSPGYHHPNEAAGPRPGTAARRQDHGDAAPFPILLAIWSSVTRYAGVVGPEQQITGEEAIRTYVMSSADMTIQEELKGSLERVKLADHVVRDRDILRRPEDEIKDTQVLPTLLGDRPVHGDLGAL